MEYSSILKLDKDATIIDVVGMYQVLSKKIQNEIKVGTESVDKLNELNTAYLLACTTKNPNELINAKNKYFLDNQVMLVISKIKETMVTFEKELTTGYGVYFNKLICILDEYLKAYYRLINYVKRAKTKEELQSIIKEFESYNWNEYFITSLAEFAYDTLMPAIYYTKEQQEFFFELAKTKTSLERLNYLNSCLKYLRKLEIVNETLINNILYNKFDFSSLTDYQASLLSSKIAKIMIDDVKLNRLTLDELMQKYNSSRVEMTEKRLVKELGLNGNPSNN